MARRLHLRVYRFILRQIPLAEDAEELTQETFLEAHRKLRAFQGQSLFSTWLLGIANNLARNFRSRAPQFRYQMVDDEALRHHASNEPDPETIAASDARMAALQHALSQLPEELYQPLALISLEGLGYEEAAQICDLSLSALKTRIFRARKKLRALLTEQNQMSLFQEME
ncbi:putative ECF subfamily RNA polymerase sigma-24 factor [Magnetofaba australis IT-1]|uniref:Putative ECF subfamily RNA polymerase sigma-24 factor n=1 Tax=Magnetofaba australis IT-1 TaxID=1434232 RepID=A0A1Y2K0Y4_9PROT|nr:putative ECF subfamily RNA polymerase sigma-24 factor [Magnetofaba australis IT-1]